MGVRIICDSASDITKEIAKELDVIVLPIKIILLVLPYRQSYQHAIKVPILVLKSIQIIFLLLIVKVYLLVNKY